MNFITPDSQTRAKVAASVVGSQDELAQVFAIRSAVYIAEQKCPYEEEFDGNDFCATHVLGRVDGEPAGAMRVRWFAGFAKFERSCVLPDFRKTGLAATMMNFCIDLARRKGFRLAYAHSQKRLVHYWEKFGFKPIRTDEGLVFSDHEYVEILLEMAPHPDAVSLSSDPYVLLRPEGKWDTPGVLERSAVRPATNPH